LNKRYPSPSAKQRAAAQIFLPETALLERCRELVESTIDEVGRMMVMSLLEASATCLTGPPHPGVAAASHVRHGSQPGAVYVGRKKVRVTRPRVRTIDGKEARIPAYELLKDGGPAAKKVHDSVLAGVSTRKYRKAVEDGLDAVGVSRSSVSRKFVRESAGRLKELMERPVPGDILAVLLDGMHVGESLLVTAIGIDATGKKHALGTVEGTTENGAVVGELLSGLIKRGLDISERILFVVDGAKALTSAIQKVCGTEHPIQRCRFHKLENVIDRLPGAKHNYVRAAMQAAWKLSEKQGLAKMKELARELAVSHHDASRSLLEGLEETFTVNRLNLPPLLVTSLGTTNLIENAHGAIQTAIHRVKRFHKPQDALRWAATALLEAEQNMRSVKGFKQLWMLQAALGRKIAEQAV
jgi:transposase-like protein